MRKKNDENEIKEEWKLENEVQDERLEEEETRDGR